MRRLHFRKGCKAAGLSRGSGTTLHPLSAATESARHHQRRHHLPPFPHVCSAVEDCSAPSAASAWAWQASSLSFISAASPSRRSTLQCLHSSPHSSGSSPASGSSRHRSARGWGRGYTGAFQLSVWPVAPSRASFGPSLSASHYPRPAT